MSNQQRFHHIYVNPTCSILGELGGGSLLRLGRYQFTTMLTDNTVIRSGDKSVQRLDCDGNVIAEKNLARHSMQDCVTAHRAMVVEAIQETKADLVQVTFGNYAKIFRYARNLERKQMWFASPTPSQQDSIA